MRRFVIASVVSLASVFVLAACGDEPKPVSPQPPVASAPPPTTVEPPKPAEPPPAPKPSMADMQKEAIAEALKGLNGQDAKKFANVYAEDGVITVAGLNEIQGRAGVEANMTEWFETFKNVKLGFSRIWVKNETLVVEWVINGTHHGQLFGVKGTEQPIGHYGISVVTVNNEGKVATEHRYGDLGTVLTQVGTPGAKVKPRPIPAIPANHETILSAGTPDEDKNVEVAKNVLASLEGGKKEADFTNLLADDVEQDGLFHLEMSKGKDGAKKFYKAFTTAFPDAKFEVAKTIGVGDFAIVESVMKGTQKGAMGAIPASKKPVAVHLVDIFRIKDGKVVRAWTYQNSLEMMQQIGIFNAPTTRDLPASQAGPATPATPAKPATPATPATPAKPAGGTGAGTGGGKDTGGGGGKGTGGGGGGGGKK